MTLPFRRWTAALLFFVASAASSAAAAASDVPPAAATEFVSTAFAAAIADFGGKTFSRRDRGDLFRREILRLSDPRPVSAAVLGRYWERLPDAKRAEFERLLVDYVVAVWSESLSDISTTTRMEHRGSEDVGDRVVVHTVVAEPDDPAPSPVDWTVASGPDGKLVLVDVAADGVSVVRTMRADFAAVLRANDGNIDALFDAMRRKIGPLPAS